MKIRFAVAIASLLLVAACDNGNGGDDAGTGTDSGSTHADAGGGSHDAGHVQDAGGGNDDAGPADSGTTVADAGPADAGNTADATSGTVTLTVQNYLSWCSVGIDGGSANTTAVQTLDVAPGTVVNLMGDKASDTFVWGYWVNTTGDTGSSHDTMMSTTVTVDADMVVQACCPFASAPDTPCPPPT